MRDYERKYGWLEKIWIFLVIMALLLGCPSICWIIYVNIVLVTIASHH